MLLSYSITLIKLRNILLSEKLTPGITRALIQPT
jgi:hypothetical protein